MEWRGGHAWNRVKIDGKWYYSDLTWDANYLDKLPYCLKTEEEFCEKHELASIYKTSSNERVYAKECYDVNKIQEAMKNISTSKQVEELMDEIDKLKSEERVRFLVAQKRAEISKMEAPEGKTKLDKSDITNVIANLTISEYTNMYQAIKQERLSENQIAKHETDEVRYKNTCKLSAYRCFPNTYMFILLLHNLQIYYLKRNQIGLYLKLYKYIINFQVLLFLFV